MPKLDVEILKNDLSTRLNSLMHKKGFNIPKLSKKTEIAIGTIQKLLTDPNSNPTYSTLKALANALDVGVGALLNENDHLIESDHKIHILAWEQVMEFLNGDTRVADSFVFSSLDLTNQAFALKFEEKDIHSLFRENSILIFDPNKKPFNRSYVLVKFHNYDKPSLKQLIIEEPFFYVKSLNPEFSQEKIKLLDPKDRIIATLVQSLLNY